MTSFTIFKWTSELSSSFGVSLSPPVPPRSFYLQTLPGSGVDDVTTACEMMSLTTLSFSASPCEDWRVRSSPVYQMKLNWGRPQDALFYCNNLFFKKTFEVKPTKKKPWHFHRDSGQQSAGNYLKFNFCTAFSATRQGWVNWLGTGRGFILLLCVDLVHSGLAVLPDWLWWFSLHSPLCTVQYSPETWCLLQNVEAEATGDWNMLEWRFKTSPSYFTSYEYPLK